jgi:hypothetical protein
MPAGLMDPTRSRALLIGAEVFPNAAGLDNLPSVPRGIKALRNILIDKRRGGLDRSACRTMINPSEPRQVARALLQCAEEAEDCLFVYYSGHGVPSPDDGSLLLAIKKTDRHLLPYTAVPIDWVTRELRRSAQRW